MFNKMKPPRKKENSISITKFSKNMKGGFMKYNKKAVSAVVATVLIVMITVAAVAIIWAAILPMVQDNLSKGTSCFDVQADITLGTEGYPCITAEYTPGVGSTCNTTVGGKCVNVSVQISNGPNAKFTLVGADLIFSKGGNTITQRVNSANLPGNNGEKVIVLSNESLINTTSVKIAPVITVGKTEQTCYASGDVVLATCAS